MQNSALQRSICFLGVVSVTAGVVSCRDVTRPRASDRPDPRGTPVLRSVASEPKWPDVPRTLRVDLPAQDNSMLTAGPLALPGSYDSLTLVKVTASGFVNATRSSSTWLWGPNANTPAGRIDAAGLVSGGYANCVVRITVAFASGSAGWCRTADTTNAQWGIKEIWEMTAVVQGQGAVTRSRGPGCSSGNFIGNTSTFGPCYLFTGGQTIVVTPTSDKLLLVASRSAIVPGSVVTFMASALNGTRFEVREWGYVRMDGTLAPIDPSCQAGAVTCATALSDSGTMFVRAWMLDLRRMEVARANIAVAPPRLELECPPSVSRGRDVTCTATVAPPIPFTFLGWHAVANEIATDSVVNRALPEGTVSEWIGPAVLDTWVYASAEVEYNGTRLLTDSVAYRVDARTWSPYTPLARDDGHGDLPDPPEFLHDMAHIDIVAPTADSALADGGPNRGWWYVPRELTGMETPIHFNRAFDPSHPWHVTQEQLHQADPTYCGTAFITDTLRKWAELHEGLTVGSYAGYEPLTSHYAEAARFLRSKKVHERMEQVHLHEQDRSQVPEGFKGQLLFTFWSALMGDGSYAIADAVVDEVYGIPRGPCTLKLY